MTMYVDLYAAKLDNWITGFKQLSDGLLLHDSLISFASFYSYIQTEY